MIEEIAPAIYRIGVPLTGNPLKELNSYFIRGQERELLIDTGFRSPECRSALEAGLAELGSRPEIRDVLVTHMHSDHSGMADLFAGPERKVYISRTDLQNLDEYLHGSLYRVKDQRYMAEGFPVEAVRNTVETNPARMMALPDLDDRFTPLEDGQILEAGPYRLRTVCVPGHTPGNIMLWIAEQGIMFTGDHILFDISPNITVWETVEDSLGDYLDSLHRAASFPVRTAFPGHRKTGDYHQRIEALLAHHEKRLSEAYGIVEREPGLTAYEITGRMKWRIRANNWEDFPTVQKWFAVGECLAHLDHLRLQGRLRRQMEDGLWRYYIGAKLGGTTADPA